MTMRYDDGPFICTPGEKPWSHCIHRWKVSIVSVLLFLLLPLLTTYRQNYYLVMGDPFMDYKSNASTQCYTAEISRGRRSIDASTPAANTKTSECLVFNEDCIVHICNQPNRTKFNELHLNFCNWRKLDDTVILDLTDSTTLQTNQLTSSCLHNQTNCTECLTKIMNLDKDLKERASKHASYLERYDCKRKYSMWAGEHCSNCTNAYKNWMCATAFQYVHNGSWIKPSIKFCKQVTTQCPYLLPDIPYCGQRSFFCPDDEALQHPKSSYAPDGPCFNCNEVNDRYVCDSLLYENETSTQKCAPPSRSVATSLYRASITVSTCFMIGALWLVLCILQQFYDLPEGYT
ncbi:uncharacterized protein [Amphiura filiformis]|uniref:uncharacterized protein n=1 Tax=Amphiura filiformis TaxID=82378 RepID=UPI003B21FD1C